MENINEKRLRLWKERQEAEGYDVSKVKTLEEAEHFFDKKRTQRKPAPVTACTVTPSHQREGLKELPKEEVITDEDCNIDPPDRIV